jgi:hypothetical protein
MKILLLALVISICPADTFKITSLLSCLDTSHKVTNLTLKGKFDYTQSNTEQDVYTSIFNSDSLVILYTLHGDPNVRDTFLINDNIIAIDNKYDPLSLEIAKISFEREHYICLLGKSVSASGTGVQISFYTLLKMEGNKVVQTYFFQSRFGSFLNIGDFNNDNELEYIKVVNGDGQNKYNVRLYNVETDSSSGNCSIVLLYNGNDLFSLIKENWLKKIDFNCIKSNQ